MEDVIFREVQQFRQPILWLVLICLVLIFVGLAVKAGLAARGGMGGSPAALGFLAGALLTLVVCGLFFVANLTTEVRSDGVYVRFFPLQLSFHEVPTDRVREIVSITYRPLRDYGGWGMRYSSHGRAYNVSGDRGVRISYSEDESTSILIGSRRPDELAAAISSSLSARRSDGSGQP